jgi:hypothetical protein
MEKRLGENTQGRCHLLTAPPNVDTLKKRKTVVRVY